MNMVKCNYVHIGRFIKVRTIRLTSFIHWIHLLSVLPSLFTGYTILENLRIIGDHILMKLGVCVCGWGGGGGGGGFAIILH